MKNFFTSFWVVGFLIAFSAFVGSLGAFLLIGLGFNVAVKGAIGMSVACAIVGFAQWLYWLLTS